MEIKNIDQDLINACENGELEVVKRLLQIKPYIDISYDNENAFRTACTNGHLEIAQLLLQIKPNIDISAENNFSFVRACYYNHLEVAQWLIQIKPDIDISVKNDFTFSRACANGKLEIAKWLLSIKPNIDIFAEDSYAFNLACINGHLEVAQWLEKICPDNFKILSVSTDNTEIGRGSIYNIDYKILKTVYLCGTKIVTKIDKCLSCNLNASNIITNCNHNFCDLCIKEWLNDKEKCPICNEELENVYLIKLSYE